MAAIARRWHRWGRLRWYLGTHTPGRRYGWRWFYRSSLNPRSRCAAFGPFFIVMEDS